MGEDDGDNLVEAGLRSSWQDLSAFLKVGPLITTDPDTTRQLSIVRSQITQGPNFNDISEPFPPGGGGGTKV